MPLSVSLCVSFCPASALTATCGVIYCGVVGWHLRGRDDVDDLPQPEASSVLSSGVLKGLLILDLT